MKTFTSIQLAAVGVLSLASLATAIPACAIDCFQGVITEHPPMDCKLDTMYLCFCAMPSLQGYFVECARSDCKSSADAKEAISFGVDLCDGLGYTVVVPPESAPSTTKAEVTETTAAAATTSAVAVEETTKAAEETTAAAEETTKAAETSAEESVPVVSDSSVAEQPTEAANTSAVETSSIETVVATPTGSGSAKPTGTTPDDSTTTPSTVIVSGANAVAVSGFLAAAGVAAAAFLL
ncbi:hypothetical protein QQX98_011534 [Neonectria punicea]|uniref:CFEM domain-containing protein n=1 Tax=Neonectria punicea TaxID=979145 RepID=A0ABR1GLE3_9HYPO